MAFNGTGAFSRLYSWTTDKVNNIRILASRFDAEMDGFATGLTNCITKDGQTTTTTRVPFAAGVSLSGTSTINPSAIVNVTPNGGTVARDLKAILSDRLDVRSFGAGGAGATDDTTALQAFLNYHASTGTTAYLSDGDYNISSSLTLPDGIDLVMADGCVIIATATMTAMLDTVEATTYDYVMVSGGELDCNGFADTGIWPKTFALFRIENLQIRDNKLYGIRLGSVGGGSAYEAFVRNVRIIRGLVAAPVSSAGIFIDQCGDSHFSDIVIMGQERGVVGSVSDSKFTRVHCWNALENGAMLSGFFLDGFDTMLVQCQVDGPFSSSGFYLGGGRNHMVACCVNMTPPSYGGVDLQAVGVFLEVGSEAVVSSCSIKAQSALARLSADVSGDIQGAKLINNQSVNCLEVALDSSKTLVRAWVTFNGTGTPAIRASHNVSSITDLGVGKYRVNTTNSMRDTNFCLQTTGHTDGGATNGILAYGQGRTTFTADVWTYDPVAVAFADPTYCNVLIMGT